MMASASRPKNIQSKLFQCARKSPALPASTFEPWNGQYLRDFCTAPMAAIGHDDDDGDDEAYDAKSVF